MSEGKNEVAGIRAYRAPAGGWGALKAVAVAVRAQMDTAEASATLLRTNQPQGFDCPGCAWPDKQHKSTFQFCENGAKAVTWEATNKRATPALFERYPVSALLALSDHELESFGRLTQPMVYEAQSDSYRALPWEEAFARIGAMLNAIEPTQVDFYTSGRTSNEAAFLYQLFARVYGSNNFPDCSNLCHEPTSRGLPQSIGMGKGSVSLEDFDACELIISVGHNPGTNHPRMMGVLHDAARRGVPIVVLNSMRERALEQFASPQDPVEMLTGGETAIASQYLLVKAGGDAAALKGIMKALLALEVTEGGVLDRAFIEEHTNGFDALCADLRACDWPGIEAACGLHQSQLEAVARLYATSKATIISYGMGITQHRSGTANVRLLCDLLLLKGNIGKPGAGICPLRGHSNVQGNRTVGITELPSAPFLQRLGQRFGFTPPSQPGRDAVRSMQAIVDGQCQALICLGGNLAVALPDPQQCYPAMAKLQLAVHVATKLNRSHLLVSRATFLLPCLGRTEEDIQGGVAQAVTVEDSMSMVHASSGKLAPASAQLKSEVAIVTGIAAATLPDSGIDWAGFCRDYDGIRDAIAEVFPEFHDYNARIRVPGGFRLPLPATERVWRTASGKAEFFVFDGLDEDAPAGLRLITVRSHDQYNTTIYAYDDRYRGVFGRRDVLFMHADDLARQGLQHGDRVDVRSCLAGDERVYPGLTVVAYAIAPGTVAAYYPEANCLIPLDYADPQSGTPAYKSVPVRVVRSGA